MDGDSSGLTRPLLVIEKRGWLMSGTVSILGGLNIFLTCPVGSLIGRVDENSRSTYYWVLDCFT